MKNLSKLFGIIVIITIIGFVMLTCGSDDPIIDDKDTVITVDKLPDFPSGSNPAVTKEDAENILEELRQSWILGSILDEIWDVIDEYGKERENYSFTNRSLPGGYVRVSASETENETNTGGF